MTWLEFSRTEFLDLTLEEVGKRIELVYSPMRKDGIKGNPRTIVSNVIAPGELYIKELNIYLELLKAFGGFFLGLIIKSIGNLFHYFVNLVCVL